MTPRLKKLDRNDGTSNDMVQGKSMAFPPEELTSLLEQQLSALGDPGLHTREMAIGAVVRLGVEVTPFLWPLLDAPTWGHREIAVVEALKRLGDPRTVAVLEGWLVRGDPVQRLHAIRGLRSHHCGHEPFAAALEDGDWQVRLEAVFALSDIGRVTFMPLFAARLKDEHYRVRAAAANALGRLRDPAAAKHLAQALRDEDSRVQAMALWSVQHIGCAENLQEVLTALGSTDFEVRSRAIQALSKLRAGSGVGPLVAMLDQVPHAQQIDIVDALGCIGSTEAVPTLVGLVESAHPTLKHHAAWSLAAIGKAAVPYLQDLARHQDPLVRYHAVFALGYMGLAQVAETVYAARKDESTLVRSEATDALERLKQACGERD